jgi:hypothetical protein
MRFIAIVALAGCGGDAPAGDVVAATSILLGAQTGMGPSPLDGLLGETIELEVQLVAPVIEHATVEACRWTVHTTEMPVAIASGEHAAIVQTEILDRLPAWDLRLALCDPASDSSVTLHADFEGLAVVAGCLALPASAQVRDGNGEPRWTDFTASACDATVYDELHGRLFSGRDFTMTFTHR